MRISDWSSDVCSSDLGEVLHVGDHIEMDVLGAARAGLRSCWIDRESRDWPHEDIRPDLHFDTLAALADWLDAASPPLSKARSEERRVGKECVSTCRSRWSRYS